MDRGKKVRRVQELDGKVFRVYNVKVEKHYLHPDYELIAHDPAVLSETGRLDVFEVKSISGTRPNFSGRWDGGDRNKPEKIRYDLDIDILEVARKIQRQFKNCENGYSGHHTTPSARMIGNAYDLSISIPGEVVFEGTVSFNRQHGLGIKADVKAMASMNFEKIPRWKAPFKRIAGFLRSFGK